MAGTVANTKLQQFRADDPRLRRTTFWRPCSVEQGTVFRVSVAWKRGSQEIDLRGCRPDEVRFIKQNITPAEHEKKS